MNIVRYVITLAVVILLFIGFLHSRFLLAMFAGIGALYFAVLIGQGVAYSVALYRNCRFLS